MATYTRSSFSRTLLLQGLEILLNEVLLREGAAKERLSALDGTVIRVRIEKPDDVFFILLHEDGVEVLTEFDGYVSVRVRGELGAMLHWWLAPNATTPSREVVRVLAPEEQLELINDTISEFSLWSVLRHWLDRYARLDELLALLRREDQPWFQHISTLPSTIEKLEVEMAHQRLRHEDLADEMAALKLTLRRERLRDLLSLVAAGLCFGLAVPLWQGQFAFTAAFSAAEHTVAAVTLGCVVLLLRFVTGHRY